MILAYNRPPRVLPSLTVSPGRHLFIDVVEGCQVIESVVPASPLAGRCKLARLGSISVKG